MTLIHHSNESYETAARKAGDAARAKMNAIIDAGRASALRTYEHIMTSQIEDSLVRDTAMVFELDENGLVLDVAGVENARAPMTDYALGQACARYGMPAKFARELLDAESQVVRVLAAENLETLARVQGGGRALIRTQDGKVRAVLSDSYKRLDARPMVDAFVDRCSVLGLVPCEGHVTDTRVAIKAMMPTVFEPAPGEVMCFGIQLKTSDFGAGALDLHAFVLRLACTNSAMIENVMRKVHLGRKLEEGTFSQKTYQLESETSVSALRDVMSHAFDDGGERFADMVAKATEGSPTFDASKRIEAMVKGGKLTKAEGKEVSTVYNTPDVEKLPAGNSPWRLSNAVSWFAHSPDITHRSNDRRLELEQLAGDIIVAA